MEAALEIQWLNYWNYIQCNTFAQWVIVIRLFDCMKSIYHIIHHVNDLLITSLHVFNSHLSLLGIYITMILGKLTLFSYLKERQSLLKRFSLNITWWENRNQSSTCLLSNHSRRKILLVCCIPSQSFIKLMFY